MSFGTLYDWDKQATKGSKQQINDSYAYIRIIKYSHHHFDTKNILITMDGHRYLALRYWYLSFGCGMHLRLLSCYINMQDADYYVHILTQERCGYIRQANRRNYDKGQRVRIFIEMSEHRRQIKQWRKWFIILLNDGRAPPNTWKFTATLMTKSLS